MLISPSMVWIWWNLTYLIMSYSLVCVIWQEQIGINLTHGYTKSAGATMQPANNKG